MGHLVRMVVGNWDRGGQGAWRFHTDITWPKYDVVVRENESYNTLLQMVRGRYKLDQHLHPTEPVLLTYEFPNSISEPGDYTPAPIEITNNEDVEVFMSVRIDHVFLEMYVSFGGQFVDRYRIQRQLEDVDGGGDEDGAGPYTQPWEGFHREGYILARVSVLKEICTPEEFERITNTSRVVPKGMAFPELNEGNNNSSSDGSSSSNKQFEETVQGGGVITLGKNNNSDMRERQLSLNDATRTFSSALVPLSSKGKEKVYECEDYITKIGSATVGAGLEPSTTAGEGVTLAVSTGEVAGKSVYGSFDNNLSNDFDGTSSDRAIRIGRGYPSDGDSPETTILEGEDMTKPDHLYVGKVFKDREDFKLHMSLYAITNKFRFLVKRSEPGKMLLECRGRDCGWRVYAAKIGGCSRFDIRTMGNVHSCTVNERWEFRNHATTSIVGDMIRNRYGGGGGRGPRPGALREMLRADHDIPISYWKAWKAREVAMDQGAGHAESAYLSLPTYLANLSSENPGSIVGLETDPGPDGAQRFKFLFLSFGASIIGYPYMRKVVIIDGTHLKGKYGGCLLTASAQDGNFQIFPVAFGIVDSENDQSWTWFFNKLVEVVADSEDLVFVSDRHNSIYSGIRRVYPMSQHCACLMHLQRNVQAIYKKKHLQYLIARAARAYRVEDFNVHFNEIRVIDIACADYLTRVGFEHWARSHFKGARYNIMTSNLAESLNAALAEAREYPIVGLIEYIRTMVMGWFSTRRTSAMTNVSALTPRVNAMVGRNFAVSTGYAIRHIINSEYEVRDQVGVFNRVDLDKKSCSCKEYDLIGIPCTHAVAAGVNNGLKVDTLVVSEYSNRYWLLAYTGSVNPVKVPNGEEVGRYGGLKLLPPSTRRPSGRPRKTRIPSTGEIRRSGVSKRKRVCSRCGGADHNRATCREPI